MCEPCTYSCGPHPCCTPCRPCNIPYGQSTETCLGAELEAIPQITPSPPPKPPDCEKKKPKRKRIIPLLMEPRNKAMYRLPRTPIVKKVKADVLYTTWQCCKRNGLQDETPQWLVLGKPYSRPGPGYRCCNAYFPTYNQCQADGGNTDDNYIKVTSQEHKFIILDPTEPPPTKPIKIDLLQTCCSRKEKRPPDKKALVVAKAAG